MYATYRNLVCGYRPPSTFESGVPMNEQSIRSLMAEVLAGIAPEADLSTIGDRKSVV